MSNRLFIKTIEISGFYAALTALRLPYKKNVRSNISSKSSFENTVFETHTHINANPLDLQLLTALVKRGDEHAKVLRGIIVFVEIIAPRWWWQEMLTYNIGVTHLGGESIMRNECAGLKGEALEQAKDCISDGLLQKRICMLSYQTLRRIYFQRKDLNMPTWDKFCNWLEKLPFSNELITVSKIS